MNKQLIIEKLQHITKVVSETTKDTFDKLLIDYDIKDIINEVLKD